MQALTGKPKLAEVAAALLKAKREGQLPSAFGDITLPGTQLPLALRTQREEEPLPPMATPPPLLPGVVARLIRLRRST